MGSQLLSYCRAVLYCLWCPTDSDNAYFFDSSQLFYTLIRPGFVMPKIEKSKYRAAASIVHSLRGAAHQAYFAGGCVRDMLLGVEPKDFDVATSATPDVVMGMFPKTYSVGAHFGVVLVCTPADDGGEIATEV